MLRPKDDEKEKDEIQKVLDAAAPNAARVDRARLGYLVVTVIPTSAAPEVFCALADMRYRYVALVGAPAHLFKKEP